jgi:hypothetical protein
MNFCFARRIASADYVHRARLRPRHRHRDTHAGRGGLTETSKNELNPSQNTVVRAGSDGRHAGYLACPAMLPMAVRLLTRRKQR